MQNFHYLEQMDDKHSISLGRQLALLKKLVPNQLRMLLTIKSAPAHEHAHLGYLQKRGEEVETGESKQRKIVRPERTCKKDTGGIKRGVQTL